MGSETRRALAAAGLAALASVAPAAGPVVAQDALVGHVVYEGPTLVVPALVFASTTPDGRAWRAGLAGWTVSGEWSRRLSPTRTVLGFAALTPWNSHASDRIYQDGVRADDLAYRNATAGVGAGIRLNRGSALITELRVGGHYERVEGLPDADLDRWGRPFLGMELMQTYQAVGAEDPLRSRLEGVRVQGRLRAFSGETPWAQATASLDAGHAFGPLRLRGHGSYLHGHQLDQVSRFLVGGSWDLPGLNTLYGHPYGAFRIDRGLLLRAGADLMAGGDWEVGIRAAHLESPEASHSGAMVRLATMWSGVGLHAALAFPDVAVTDGEWGRAILVAGVSAAVLW